MLVAGLISEFTDHIPAVHLLPDLHGDLAHVPIQRDYFVIMLYFHNVAVGAFRPGKITLPCAGATTGVPIWFVISIPSWKSGAFVKGFRREPKNEERKPCVGRTEGVVGGKLLILILEIVVQQREGLLQVLSSLF